MEEVCLDNFGTLVAFNFKQGRGRAEILMTFPEIQRFLEGMLEYESSRRKVRKTVLKALQTLTERDFQDVKIKANVVIGTHRVKLVPDPPDIGEGDEI